MSKPFASANDTQTQRARVTELAPRVYGYISDYDPNTGFVVGDQSVLAVDCRATPALAREFLADIATVTDLPVRLIFLTHYHAVRVMGRAGFPDVQSVIASRGTLDLIRERGAADFESEVRRFPRLFQGVDEVPGLTLPDQTFEQEMTLWAGDLELRLEHLGAGHTSGDAVAWLPRERVLFAGDLVEARCALYCGDAHLRSWRTTLGRLEALPAEVLVPGRGAAVFGRPAVLAAIAQTREFIDRLISETEQAFVRGAADLKSVFAHVYPAMTRHYDGWPIYEHCIPFNVSRAYDEVRGQAEPQIWTAERDRQLWSELHG